jgi:hypothetical protein
MRACLRASVSLKPFFIMSSTRGPCWGHAIVRAHDGHSGFCRGRRAECHVRVRRRSAVSVRFAGIEAHARRQAVDHEEPERAHRAILLLRQLGAELPAVRTFVHVGVGAAGMPRARRRLALADGRGVAPAGQLLRRNSPGVGRPRQSGIHGAHRRRELGVQRPVRRRAHGQEW